MSELSDWKRCVLPSELAAAHAQGKAEGIAQANGALDAALRTLSDQEKRIAELEAERDRYEVMAEEEAKVSDDLVKALTSERQRRDDAEDALLWLANNKHSISEAKRIYIAHARKYEPAP